METLSQERIVTGDSIQGVLSQATDSGETVEVFASAERRTGTDDFEQVAVVLTKNRLLIVSPTKDLGYELSTAEARPDCNVISQTVMPDGSLSVVLDAGQHYLGLHFPSSWRPEAESMLDLLLGRESTGEIDRFAMFQELSGLVDLAGDDAEVLG